LSKHRHTETDVLADNGADVHFGGNNWPLRVGRLTCGKWCTRVGFVHSELLKDKAPHIMDWYIYQTGIPTLVHLAGGSTDHPKALMAMTYGRLSGRVEK